MADARIDPFDVGALERSVNDSAGRVSGIWLSFVAFSAYLAAAASMITHRQIFLEEPIKLPTINIDLPLVASAILLPLLFVIYHIFVLLQVVLLARTADAYNDAIEHSVTDETDRIRVRQRLANTLFAQLFAGSSRERDGVLGWLLRLMTWITLAIAPVCVLILFEIKFLPYHSAAVTWTHRGLIALDLLAVLMLWAGAVEPRLDITWRSPMRHRALTFGALAIFILSNALITFPGEPGRLWMTFVSPSDQSSGEAPECRISKAMEGLISTSFDRLVLLGEDFVDDAKFKQITLTADANGQKLFESERTRIFRGRDLRCAHLAGTDLRLVDFSESDLSGAILRGAHLEVSTFSGANLTGVILDSAQLQNSSFAARRVMEKLLDEARLPNSSLRRAQLQQVDLTGVNLEAAGLLWANLQQALLADTNLRGASFKYATLNDARLDRAKLQGASFDDASMPRASLVSAQMQGASLQRTWMLGAILDETIMHGALFARTQLQGVRFYRSQLQGALFDDAQFEGTVFIEAQLQGIQMQAKQRTGPRDTIVSDSFLWHAAGLRCDFTHVATPNFEEIIEARHPRRKPEPVVANDQAIADFIERTLAGVPDKSRAVKEFSKDKLRKDLTTRLRTAPPDALTPVEQAWRTCASESDARTIEDFQELTAHVVQYACRFPDMNPFVHAFVGNDSQASSLSRWIFELERIPVGKLFAKSLLIEDNPQCPNAKSLDGDTKALLRYVINPGE